MTPRKTQNPRFSTAFRKAPLSFRFHASFKIVESGCWEWIGTLHTTGYGIIRDNHKDLLAHRLAFVYYTGNTDGFCVCHTCDNRKCVNPNHLFLGSREDNNNDRDVKGRGPRGERNWCAKLAPSDIPIIRKLHAAGATQIELAKRFGVSQGAISGVVNRTTWVHIR